MEAIKRKTIPIHYDKEKEILYFDQIEEFNSNNFRFLHESNNAWATHEINFNILKEFEGESTKLIRLVRNLKKKAVSGSIEFGVPIEVQYNDLNLKWKFRRLKNSEIDKYLWKADESHCLCNQISTIKNTLIESFLPPRLLPVGQGLMFVDESSRIIYDCGGTENIQMYIQEWVEAGLKFHIVISHWHYDHYCYLKELINKNLVKSLYLPEFIFESQNVIDLKKLLESKKILYVFHEDMEIENYTLIKSPSKAKRVSNMHSCILMSDNWMLTGDQGTNFINKMLSKPVNIENFQIPHHCSGDKKHHPDRMKINRIKKAWFSALPGLYNNMPSKDYISYYKMKKAAICDVNTKS